MRRKSISDTIKNLEKDLAICKFIKEKYPDVRCHQNTNQRGFSSRSVNSTYNKFEFVRSTDVLFVVPYVELPFEYNGSEEFIRINSYPRSSMLAKIYYSYAYECSVISFSRFKANLKKNKFKDDMINDCRLEIVDFIKAHSGYKLIEKNLDPGIKKLLSFI